MTIRTMRFIDRWLGIPACFILSPFCWLFDRLRSRADPDLSRTLFIELSEMGSAIIADPAMRRLRKQADAELYFAIFKDNYRSLEILKTVDEKNVFKMNAANFPSVCVEIFRFIVWCRRKKISAVVDLELFSRFTALLSLFSGARSRIGFSNFHDEGLYRGNLVNKPVRYNPHVHVAANFMSLTNRALGLFRNHYATTPIPREQLKLEKAVIQPDMVSRVKNKIRELYPAWRQESIVLLNVNASDMLPQRRWARENFISVAGTLLANFENVLLIATGAPAEREYVADVVVKVGHEKFVNSAGRFSFDELVPLYSISHCMLTNDSGPAHFASVTDLKVFVLFGPETPHLYLPLSDNAEAFYLGLPCSPCVSAANHRKTSCTVKLCLTGITPASVLSRMETYLKEQSVT